jgi:hypothetical protein
VSPPVERAPAGADRSQGPPSSLGAVYVLAGVKLALHLACVNGYGYFRDELYYLACARHLAWGYVDHPPLSVALLAAVHATLGDSRLAIRLVPALAGAAVVLLTGWLARELGGGRRAQILAALAVLVAPEYLALGHFYSMNALELLFWTGAVCLLARMLRDPDARTLRRWALLGVVLGLGLLDTASVAWLVGGLFVGLVATPHRRLLATRGPWLAVIVAAVLFAPHLVWQQQHGWPTREFMRHATQDKMASVTLASFFVEQITNLQPLSALLWLPGLGALLFWRPLERFRPLGVAYVAIFALLVVNQKSRAGYLAPAYPALFAAGGVLVEHLSRTRARRGAVAAYGGVLALGGAITAPLALPCLPVTAYVRYAAALGQAPTTEEKKELGKLPQFYADFFGWPEMADAVAAAAASLTPEERANAVVLANDYGQAGALEQFGGGRLPPVACAHNAYWWWGPRNPAPDVIVRLTSDPEAPVWLREQCPEVEARGRFDDEWVMPYENHLTIYVCRHPRTPLGAQWAERRHYD